MIMRFWSARTTEVRYPEYLRHFSQNVLPLLRSKEGFLEARVLAQSDGVVVQFIVETLWTSLEAIERFAGSDREAAVIEDEARKLLTSYDHRVQHYEVTMREERREAATSA
jgi:heme-degrading monooxygenase HmoA